MKWIEVRVIYEPDENIMVDELIASVFDDADTGGVAVERPDMEPDEGWDPGVVSKPDCYSVKGFIPFDEDAENKLEFLNQGMMGIKNQGFDLKVVTRVFDEEDWSETWKEHFWPEKITDKIVVSPTWRTYDPVEGESVINIDPGMAFGTGAHPTTRMCMNLIERYLEKGDSFLDIGTGSGILMIAAHVLGAESMAGTDFDLTAVETAEKNLDLNFVSKNKYTLLHGNLADNVLKKSDVAAANILAEVIVDLVPDLEKVLKKKGIFICSGILDEKADIVEDCLVKNGFEIRETISQDSWVAFAAVYGAE